MVCKERSSMKKVLCLIDGLGSGGAQRQLVGLANLLKGKGYDVLFAWYHKSDFYKNFLDENRVNYKQIHATNIFQKFWGVKKIVDGFKPDAIISYIDGPNMATCLLKVFRLKSTVIVSERAVLQKINAHQKRKFFLYRWADYIVSNAQEQTDLINRYFPSLRNKTVTIRNFVDTSVFMPSNTINESDDIKMLVVGRIAPPKNIIRFMDAIKNVQAKGIPLYVKWFGGESFGYHDYIDEVKLKYKKMNFGDTFQFFPPSRDILQEYQSCDVFCLPSLFEGFPNVVCEAMSCGKPILCSDVNDNAVIVHDKENGFLFDPKSTEDMTEKILKFCQMNQNERIAMGQRSRKLAIEKLSGESFVNKYISLIGQ